MNIRASRSSTTGLTNTASVGLRSQHIADLLEQRPKLGWLEIITDNFLHNCGIDRELLLSVRAEYDLSMHGVGLNLGGPEALNTDYLKRLKTLITDFEPCAVSEHAAFSATRERNFHDLLPLPYSYQALERLSERIDQTQSFLNRKILIENAVSYIELPQWQLSPSEFFNQLAERTGCGLLIDLNNLYVNQYNFPTQFCSHSFLEKINPNHVGELHLAGFSQSEPNGLLIDSHSAPVAESVWQLYDLALNKLGSKPTLIEWDNQLPSFEALLYQAELAQWQMTLVSENTDDIQSHTPKHPPKHSDKYRDNHTTTIRSNLNAKNSAQNDTSGAHQALGAAS